MLRPWRSGNAQDGRGGGGGGGGVPEKNNMEKKGAGMGRKKLGGVRGGEPRG